MKPRKPLSEKDLIERCLKNNRRAQLELFERFGPLMKAVCGRYLFDKQQITVVLNQGFSKVFQNLDSYRHLGSFEGWIRRIMVNECLNENKKEQNRQKWLTEIKDEDFLKIETEAADLDELDQVLAVINTLPGGYRTVFNLYEIEGYNHSEIAEKLGISEGASRSQLARAKVLLRKKLGHINGL